jgi:hypothetical protein
MKKLIVIAAVLLGFTSTSFAQAHADANATIVASVSIINNAGLNFGSIYSSVAGGTVSLSPDATTVRNGSGVTLGPVNGTAAQFTVTGSGSATAPKVSWTSAGTVSLTGPTGSTAMTLTGLNAKSNGTALTTGGTVTLAADGTAIIYMGGILNVNAKQLAGTYTNADAVDFTVSY